MLLGVRTGLSFWELCLFQARERPSQGEVFLEVKVGRSSLCSQALLLRLGVPREVVEWPYTTGGRGGYPPPPLDPPLQTRVGKNGINSRDILSGHFWFIN